MFTLRILSHASSRLWPPRWITASTSFIAASIAPMSVTVASTSSTFSPSAAAGSSAMSSSRRTRPSVARRVRMSVPTPPPAPVIRMRAVTGWTPPSCADVSAVLGSATELAEELGDRPGGVQQSGDDLPLVLGVQSAQWDRATHSVQNGVSVRQGDGEAAEPRRVLLTFVGISDIPETGELLVQRRPI